MTNIEALTAAVGFPVDDLKLNKSLIDADLTASGFYTRDNKTAVNKIAIDVLYSLLGVNSVSEGSMFSISYNEDGIRAQIQKLEQEIGVSGGQPTIKRRNVW